MAYSQFDLGGCGCGGCPTIGFDQSAWSVITACCNNSTIINIASDVSRLAECRIVFGGNLGTCGNAIRFSSGDWPAIKTYIEGGGRLFIAAEHNNGCLGDAANLNSFLAAVGSSMSYAGGDYQQSFPSPNLTCSEMDAGSANIAQGLSPRLRSNRFGEITGGTSVWVADSSYTTGVGKTIVAVEALGSGFLFLIGDSNHHYLCGSGCHEFFRRLWEYDDADII